MYKFIKSRLWYRVFKFSLLLQIGNKTIFLVPKIAYIYLFSNKPMFRAPYRSRSYCGNPKKILAFLMKIMMFALISLWGFLFLLLLSIIKNHIIDNKNINRHVLLPKSFERWQPLVSCIWPASKEKLLFKVKVIEFR